MRLGTAAGVTSGVMASCHNFLSKVDTLVIPRRTLEGHRSSKGSQRSCAEVYRITGRKVLEYSCPDNSEDSTTVTLAVRQYLLLSTHNFYHVTFVTCCGV